MTDKISGLNWFSNKALDAVTPDLINKVLYGYGVDDTDTDSDIGKDTSVDDEVVLDENDTDAVEEDNKTEDTTSTEVDNNTTTNTDTTTDTTVTDTPAEEVPAEPAYTAEEKAQLENDLAEYIDQYMEVASEGLSIEEAAAFDDYIKGITGDFVESYLSEHSGTIDMMDATAAFEEYIMVEAENWKANNEVAGAQLESLMSADPTELYNALLDETEYSLQGNNRIGTQETETLKDMASDYIISTMLNGAVDTSLLSGISKNYATNSNYQKAKIAIDKMKNAGDSQTQLEYLNEAKEYLNAFMETGTNQNNLKNTLISGIDNRENQQLTEEKAQLKEDILPMVDVYMEEYIQANPDLSEEEINQVYEYLTNSLDEFIESEYDGEEKAGRLKTRLQVFLDGKIEQQKEVAAMMEDLKADPTGKFEELQALADEVLSDKFVSGLEKEDLVAKTSDFLINQMLNDADASDLLKNISSRYSTNEDYQNAKALVDQLKAATDPDEIQELYDKATEAMDAFLNNYEGSDIAKAIQSTGPVEIGDEQKNRVIQNSTIGTDYSANVSRSLGGRIATKDKMSKMEEVQAMARADLEAVAASLKEDLKEQLGSNYDEAKVSQWIIDATNDTIAMFTENNYEHDCSGDYNVPSDSQAFVWNYRGSIKKHKNEKGRWSYNVQALTNTFMEKFNETSKLSSTTATDPTQKSYDKENVIANSVGNDYYINKNYTTPDATELINNAKSVLTEVSSALRTNLSQQGISVADIDTIIDDAMAETVDEVMGSDTELGINNGSLLKIFGAGIPSNPLAKTVLYEYNTRDLVDTFLSKVEDKAELVKQIEVEEDENAKKTE